MVSFVLLMVAADTVGTWALHTLRFSGRTEAIAYRLLVGLCICAVLAVAVGSVSLWLAEAALGATVVARIALRVVR